MRAHPHEIGNRPPIAPAPVREYAAAIGEAVDHELQQHASRLAARSKPRSASNVSISTASLCVLVLSEDVPGGRSLVPQWALAVATV